MHFYSIVDNIYEIIKSQQICGQNGDQISGKTLINGSISLLIEFIYNQLSYIFLRFKGKHSFGSDGNHSMANTSSTSFSSSSRNRFKTSKNKRKVVSKSGKQLRYLYKKHNLSMTSHLKNALNTDSMITRTRSGGKREQKCQKSLNSVKLTDKSAAKVTKNGIKCERDVKSVRNNHKLTTTVTRSESTDEREATVSPESYLDSEFKEKLVKFSDENNRKGRKRTTNPEFKTFLPEVRLERLRIESIAQKKRLIKTNSLVKDAKGPNKVNSIRSEPKLSTTVTRSVSKAEREATVSPESNLDSELIEKLIKFSNKNKRKNRQKTINPEFRPFLPYVRLEKLGIDSKAPIKGKENTKSLLKDTKALNNKCRQRVLRSNTLKMVINTAPQWKWTVINGMRARLKKIDFKKLSNEGQDTPCPFCGTIKPKFGSQLMATYLKNAFRKRKSRTTVRKESGCRRFGRPE